jgi:tRNA uridine 5-carboxymethylaminomethyl modification enzyme
VLYRCRYHGYLIREERQIGRLSELEHVKLPADLDYSRIRGLRNESVQKLSSFRPVTLGQAGRLSGVNPADIGILMVWLNKNGKN